MEIPSLVFNVLALLTSGILSWKLTKTFTWEAFKKTGADRKVSRAYKVCSSFTRLFAFRDEELIIFILLTGCPSVTDPTSTFPVLHCRFDRAVDRTTL
jgi:hypothetical protein